MKTDRCMKSQMQKTPAKAGVTKHSAKTPKEEKRLASFLVGRVFTLPLAKLVHLNSLAVIDFVLLGDVVAALA
jgi:hypothetical protein